MKRRYRHQVGNADMLPEKCPNCGSKKLQTDGISSISFGAFTKLRSEWKVDYVDIDMGVSDGIEVSCLKCEEVFIWSEDDLE